MDWIVEHYNWWRAGHIIFVIFWMAGLLFLPRQFVYQFQTEPESKSSKVLIFQQKRLIRIILNPAMVGVWVFGILLLASVYGRSGSGAVFGQLPWIIKLSSVTLVSLIHFFYLAAHKNFAREYRTYSEKFWRLINEAPALLSILIVITAVVFL
jgi:putative membrane protein